MAAMWTLLSVFLCISTVRGEDETCATCGQSPPAQSAALLQSSVQRNSKTAAGPHVFSPAQLFGPGPMGRHVSQMGRMGPRMGPHPHQRMSQPHFSFEQRRAGGQSKGESLYGGAELTPCQDPHAWTPDNDIYGWCDMYTAPVQPDEATCNAAGEGCRYNYGYCYCEKSEGCNAVGGIWNPWTCRQEMEQMMPEYLEKILEAKNAGTCENKEVWGMKVEDLVAWPASKCCTDYPSTLCDHNVQPMNPCKEQTDFKADAYAYAYCDLWSSPPSKEMCDATPDCKDEWGYCTCKTKASCELLGGYFMGTTCQEELGYWYPGVHEAVKEALDKQTCQGAFKAQNLILPVSKTATAASAMAAMAAMWTLLSVFLCISAVRGEDETCATCGQSPPAQSAALLQSSVQRNSKTAVGPHVFSPAQLFGPGPMGRHVSQAQMGRMGPRMGPHPHQRMSQPHFSFEQRRAGGQSKGESLYGGAVLTPCQDPSAWTPEKDVYGWCDMYSMPVQPDAATCDAGDGCRYSYGYCYCDKKEGCNAVGGTWNGYTCREEMENMFPDYLEKIREAAAAGTCEGKDHYGYGVKDMVAYPAMMCCTDYPSTMCEHNVQPMTPCKSEAEFLPDAYAWAYCDLSATNPPKETCDATPDCKEEWGWCNCQSKASCELLGGYFQGGTCKDEMKWWNPGDHKGVKEALDKGTCAGVEGAWGDIKYQVDWIGHLCCASKKSVCEELDHYDSGYSSTGMY